MIRPYTIGITGGSGSGKTFFLKELSSRFRPNELCLLSQDNYYRDRNQQPVDNNGVQNFDLPEAIDREAFLKDLLKLKSGEAVTRKEYTFNNPETESRIIEFKVAPVIIVEGLFVQYFKKIEKELDLKIYIEAKDYVKLSRRIQRDRVERGYDVEDVLYRYRHHVMPIYEELIDPLKHNADLIIPNNGHISQALDVIVHFLQAKIRRVAI